MSASRRPRRSSFCRMAAGFAVVVGSASCSDLTLEPSAVPDRLVIEPADTFLTQGDQARFRVTVLDQDGQPFPGVPSWAPPRWEASIPEALTIAPDGTMDAVGGGEVRVEARVAGLRATSTVRVNPDQVVLSAPAVYLAQAVQNQAGTVPLVAGRDALLRVFVTSAPGSFYQPKLRASFHRNGEVSFEALLLPGSYLIPDVVDEQRMARSFNAVIPGSVLQPGVELVVDLDVEGAVPLAPGSQLRVPAEGRTALDVREVPPMTLNIVPTLLARGPDEGVLAWTDGLDETSSAIRYTRTVLPVGDIDVVVREPYTTFADLTTEDGWSQYLREINVMRLTDDGGGYYYGAVVLPSGSPWGGLGFIGVPASVGRPTETTLAHELGHNMSLRHAPCGGAGGPDPNYPYVAGAIGAWGYSNIGGSGLATLQDPDRVKDLMGYCNPRWVSDYHFTKALNHRMRTEPEPASTGDASPEPVLLLWGGVEGGRLVLEPAFALEAPPALPTSDGPYRLEGRGDDGSTLFGLTFDLPEVAQGGGQFAFAVPLGQGERDALETVSLTGPEGATTLDRSSGSTALLVRSTTSGQLRGIVRGRDLPSFLRPGTVVIRSDGLPDRGVQGIRE